jgi:hypothetical protein
MLRRSCIFLLVAFIAGVLGFGGCSTSAPPHSAYPVTYRIQVDNTPAHADTSPQNPNLSPTQDVEVVGGQRLYYQVVSPVDVTVYFYGMEGEGQRVFLGQMQGRTFASSVTPNTNALEFVFVATQPNSSATLKFTLSDQPIALVAAP